MNHILLDSLPIWTTAQAQKTSNRGISASNQQLLGIQKLRELILELAVRGKLVPQDPNDEPASELLKRIEAEKRRLIKTGKIKKQNELSKIEEDEKPFDLPIGWEWCKLGEISNFVNGFAFKSVDFTDEGIGIIKIGDIQDGEISTHSMSKVNFEIVKNIDRSLQVQNGDLVIAMSGATTGKLGINKSNEVFYLNQRVGKIEPYCISLDFLYYPLTTKIQENLEKSMGSAIPNLSTVQIKNIVIALPPLAEQHRIVAKVDELMALCDELEKEQTNSNTAHETLVEVLLSTLTDAKNSDEFKEAWQRIAGCFDILFTTEHSIDKLKQTILQLAVMGKLVPQDPNDEPASELLKKIAKEKARLVKEGKIKKQAALPEISEEEKPFELPKGWEWVRFGELINVKSELVNSLDYPELDQVAPDSIEKNTGNLLFRRTVAESGFRGPNNRFYKGQILYSKIRPSLSKAIIAKFDGLCSADMYPLESMINSEFLLKEILSEEFLKQVRIVENRIKMPKLNALTLSCIIVPLPPLAEQQRIVSKADEFFALCDSLKEGIRKAQEIQNVLAEEIVRRVVK